MSSPRVDLNADLGEGGGDDARLMDLVSSASVACGLHAGDPSTMRRTVELAAAKGVAIGAHPGFADREGFGRRELPLPPAEIYDLALYQIGALRAFAQRSDLRLQHVKPHGALYNLAARSAAIAEALVAATADHGGHLIFVGLPFSEMQRAAARAGVPFAAEVFADRSYQDDGALTPRDDPSAFIADPGLAAARVVTMVREGRVQAVSGAWVRIEAHTVCLHGDRPRALAFAGALRRALGAAGVDVAPLRGWL